MSTIPSGSLPPMLPEEMASILGDQSAVQALGQAAGTSPFSSTAGDYLDLSPEALQLTAGEQAEMAQLEDDASE